MFNFAMLLSVFLSVYFCIGVSPSLATGVMPGPSRSEGAYNSETPLILKVDEGERRIRRVMGGALAIIKVDKLNGGSPQMVMGYEEIPPGQEIEPHHHPMADEIVFIHSGSGLASLGDQSAEVHSGGTLFIPRGTRVRLQNTGNEPIAVAYFFSAPGYEEYLRDTSVLDGQKVIPLTAAELSSIREKQVNHIVFDELKS